MDGAIDELVRDHKVGGLVLFLERANRRERQDALHAQVFHAVNVGAKVDFRRQDAVSAAMARKKRHLAPFQRAEHVSVRRFAERGLHCNFTDVCEAGHGIQTTAAHNADFSLLQESLLTIGVISDYNENRSTNRAYHMSRLGSTATGSKQDLVIWVTAMNPVRYEHCKSRSLQEHPINYPGRFSCLAWRACEYSIVP